MNILKTVTTIQNTKTDAESWETTEWENVTERYILTMSDVEQMSFTREEAGQLQDLLNKLLPLSSVKLAALEAQYQYAQIKPLIDLMTEEAKEFMRQGKKIDAIKALRDVHHLGLKEAKDVIEAWAKENVKVIPETARELFDKGLKAQAVRRLQETHGMDYVKACEVVEGWIRHDQRLKDAGVNDLNPDVVLSDPDNW